MVKELLNEGAFLDIKDQVIFTTRVLQFIKSLCALLANHQTGKTPLATAIEIGNTMIIDILIAAKDAEFQHSPLSPYTPSTSNSEYGDDEAAPYFVESDLHCPSDSAVILEQPSDQRNPSVESCGLHHHHHHYHHHHHHHHHEIHNCAIAGECEEIDPSPLSNALIMAALSPAVDATVLLLQPKKPSYVNRFQTSARKISAYLNGVVPP